MTLGEIIRAFREEHDLSMDDFAKASGISKAYVSLLEKNTNPKTKKSITPSIKSIKLAANAMHCDFDQLFKQLEGSVSIDTGATEADFLSPVEKSIIEKYRVLDDYSQRVVESVLEIEYLRATKEKQVPRASLIHYVGKIAAAGKGVYIDGIPGETITVQNMPADADFAIGVSGDSMEPDYKDGDKVYIRKQTEVEYGEVGLWQIGNEFFIKEYAPEGLKSRNPKYPVITAEEIRLIGKVIGKV